MIDELSPLRHSLALLGETHPTDPKFLVGPTLLWGRELLRSLSVGTGGWIGWEPVTLWSLAGELGLVALSEAGTRVGSDVEIGAIAGAALDQCIAQHQVPSQWHALAANAGFRRAVEDAVLELRVAGVTPDAVRGLQAAGTAKPIATVLERYSALLASHGLADAAAVFSAALESFEREAPFLLDGSIVLAPGLTPRGLPGQLLKRLIARGASVLNSDAEFHSQEATIFVAATPYDEVREALRRAVAEGVRLDQVELVCSDVDSYGIALDALARHLGLQATLQEGLPWQRARVGRALARLLDWMEQGLPADLLREALVAGDIAPPTAGPHQSGATLARALRLLRIGWGRSRYETALQQELDPELAALLTALLDHLPPTTERGAAAESATTPQAIAQSLLHFLDLVPLADASDRFNADRLRLRLEALAGLDEAAQPFSTAIGAIREALSDFRIWPDAGVGGSPRLSRGGAVHLGDFRHAGVTGRPRVFILGLDAGRTTGPIVPDPMLPDVVRSQLAGLATTADRRAEARWWAERAVRQARGTVTLSYSAGTGNGDATRAAPLLLDIARELMNEPALDYSSLRQRLGAPVCAVPESGTGSLDARDVWLGAIAGGAAALDGEAVVRSAFPGLDAGIVAVRSLNADAITDYQGLVAAAAGKYDVVGKGARAVSPTSLELLSKCPLSWFYKRVLELKLPDDPEYDPAMWLDPLMRGSLLHKVFEQFVARYRDKQADIRHDAAGVELLEIADAALARQRETDPPPSETVFLAERQEIHQAARSFLSMERGLVAHAAAPSWGEVEWKIDGVVIALPDGSALRCYGFIDRIDTLASGARLVVDYKTGSPYPYRKASKEGPLNGGRQLQPALYAAALTAAKGVKVERFEYRFPTSKGRNLIVAHHAAELGAGLGIVPGVLEPLRNGAFLPTMSDADCKFCDHAEICRVKGSEEVREKMDSPRANWAKAVGESADLYRAMRARRTP